MYDIEYLKFIYEDNIECYETIDSTNEEAKRKVGIKKQDYIIVADEQTSGKGRKGRVFYSPSNEGIYVTFIHYTDKQLEDVLQVTTALAVIVRRAIYDTYGISCKIKWVNDLYYNNKKVSGILCECIMKNSEINKNVIICGVGINISTNLFPDFLNEKAGSISEINDPIKNSQIIMKIEHGLKDFYDGKLDYMKEYVENSLVFGKEVELFDQKGGILSGTVYGFDEKGAIKIKEKSGEVKTINSGEISLVMK